MKTVFFQRMGRGLREKIQLAQIGGHQSPRINQERNVRVFSGGPYYCRPLCAPILPPLPFDLSIRPPSRRGDVPRLQKDFPGKSAFPLFSPRLLPARVIRPGPKSHHNQTERNEVTTTTEGRTPPSCSSCLSEGKYTRTVYSNVWKNL